MGHMETHPRSPATGSPRCESETARRAPTNIGNSRGDLFFLATPKIRPLLRFRFAKSLNTGFLGAQGITFGLHAGVGGFFFDRGFSSMVRAAGPPFAGAGRLRGRGEWYRIVSRIAYRKGSNTIRLLPIAYRIARYGKKTSYLKWLSFFRIANRIANRIAKTAPRPYRGF